MCFYLLYANEVKAILGLKIIIHASSKYKNALSIVEHYYSYHIF
jgi:hypothetical protein